MDALALGKNVNVAPLRCRARSLRIAKAFKLLSLSRLLEEGSVFDNCQVRACQMMKCSWVWAVRIRRVYHQNYFLVKDGEKVNLQCCIFLVQKENISSSW